MVHFQTNPRGAWAAEPFQPLAQILDAEAGHDLDAASCRSIARRFAAAVDFRLEVPTSWFEAGDHVRVLVDQRPQCQAMVWCWWEGQRTTLRDHGDGAILVLHGSLRHQRIDRRTGATVSERILGAGETAAIKPKHFHRLENSGARFAATLHLFAKPYLPPAACRTPSGCEGCP